MHICSFSFCSFTSANLLLLHVMKIIQLSQFPLDEISNKQLLQLLTMQIWEVDFNWIQRLKTVKTILSFICEAKVKIHVIINILLTCSLSTLALVTPQLFVNVGVISWRFCQCFRCYSDSNICTRSMVHKIISRWLWLYRFFT